MDRTYLAQLSILSAVAAHRSFRGAAKELGIAPSAVSHAVSRLEAGLGVRLLARTTRSVAPTEEGRQLLERLAPALSEISQALGAVAETRDHPAGNLRITAPRFATDTLIAPRLGEFLGRYPDIVLEIAHEDGFTDIVASGYDAGIRLEESLEADMIAVPVGPLLRGAVVATPAYFEAHGRPSHPRDLLGHRCVLRRFTNGALYHWDFEKEGQTMVIPVTGPLILDEDRPMIEAVLSGAGLGYFFEVRVIKHIASRRLERVMEDWCEPYPGPYAYYPSRRQMRPALRAFIDFFRRSA